MTSELEYLCDHLTEARTQLGKVRRDGADINNIIGYMREGCYTCDGIQDGCEKYSNVMKQEYDSKKEYNDFGSGI